MCLNAYIGRKSSDSTVGEKYQSNYFDFFIPTVETVGYIETVGYVKMMKILISIQNSFQRIHPLTRERGSGGEVKKTALLPEERFQNIIQSFSNYLIIKLSNQPKTSPLSPSSPHLPFSLPPCTRRVSIRCRWLLADWRYIRMI